MTQAQPTRLWGGRFADGPSDAMAALSRSVHFDWRLAPYDIAQTQAHAKVLHDASLLTEDELALVTKALSELLIQVQSGEVIPDADDEDVHTAIDRNLMLKLGDLGG